MREVEVRAEGIRLGQLLKLAGFAGTGSDAKVLLELGEVEVNGQSESRRGRQLGVGDVVECGEESVRLTLAGVGPAAAGGRSATRPRAG